ncbi:MAG: outer membrane beta-barrel protein [Bacteroidota bacterium]
MHNLLAVLGLFACVLTPVSAQDIRLDQIALGLRGGYEFDDVSEFSVGGEARVYLKDQPYFINPAVDVYLMSGQTTLWQADLNALYLFQNDVGILPYMGGGLGYTRIALDDRSRSETGINLVLGIFIEVTYVRLFVQGRSTLSNFDTISAQAGMSFPFFRR